MIAFVKRQKPTVFSGKARTEFDTGVIHGEMYHTALEGKQRLSGIAVLLILRHRVIGILFGQLVFQLERDHGQTVEKDAQIQRQFPRVRGIAELPCDAENILRKVSLRFRVSFRGREIKENQINRVHLDSVPQNINHAAFRKFALQTVQKLPFLLCGLEYPKAIHGIRLCVRKEAEQTGFINGVFLIIVRVRSFLIAIVIHKPVDNQAFQSFFRGICKRDHPFCLSSHIAINLSGVTAGISLKA